MSVAVYNLINRFTSSGATNAQQAMQGSQAMLELLEAGIGWPALMVLGILQTIPIFVMFLVCREYLLKGVRLRGLK
jgi:ABC-type glycerol-3-phosphate transport system permease component